MCAGFLLAFVMQADDYYRRLEIGAKNFEKARAFEEPLIQPFSLISANRVETPGVWCVHACVCVVCACVWCVYACFVCACVCVCLCVLYCIVLYSIVSC